MKTSPIFNIDFYKADHRRQYPEGTTKIHSNFTARSNALAPFDDKPESIIIFGIQYMIKKYLIEEWQHNFFDRDIDKICYKYESMMKSSLNVDYFDTSHIKALHKLGFLPIKILALPEGTACPIGVPFMTIENTMSEFFWLTNYLETAISAILWKPTTVATIANEVKKIGLEASQATCDNDDHLDFQFHDFSMRGMSGIEDAAICGAAHLTSFLGTDTVPALEIVNEYYGDHYSFIGGSVPATEHSVMCMYGQDRECEAIRHLITDVYPEGIVSIVSDSWDYFNVIENYGKELKDIIMSRNGKLVFRPDSGNAKEIIMKSLQILWDIFGGTRNSKGFKVIDSHVGLIYGDSITPRKAKDILRTMCFEGWAASNVVFGIGSFTYQHLTRDSFSFAVKSTYGEINGIGKDIFKDPITDDGTKKSARGRVNVKKVDGLYILEDQLTEDPKETALKLVFCDGKMPAGNIINFEDIRRQIRNNT